MFSVVLHEQETLGQYEFIYTQKLDLFITVFSVIWDLMSAVVCTQQSMAETHTCSTLNIV